MKSILIISLGINLVFISILAVAFIQSGNLHNRYLTNTYNISEAKIALMESDKTNLENLKYCINQSYVAKLSALDSSEFDYKSVVSFEKISDTTAKISTKDIETSQIRNFTLQFKYIIFENYWYKTQDN